MDFYDMLEEVLPRDYKCPDCGEHMWMEYGDGHVWYDCLNCDYEKRRQEKLRAEHCLEIAGYVCDWPVPTRPAPTSIEVREKPEKYSWQKDHETKYYRRLVG